MIALVGKIWTPSVAAWLGTTRRGIGSSWEAPKPPGGLEGTVCGVEAQRLAENDRKPPRSAPGGPSTEFDAIYLSRDAGTPGRRTKLPTIAEVKSLGEYFRVKDYGLFTETCG